MNHTGPCRLLAGTVAAFGVAAGVAACAAPEKGVVYGRWHYPESQWVQMICSSYNKNGMCIVQMPIVMTDPERWSLGLRDGEDEGQRSVTEHEYNSCQVDDHYPGCGSRDLPG